MSNGRSGRLTCRAMATRPTSSPTREKELLEAARGGDEPAFLQLVDSYRGELHAHCYRMVGSVHDAEDALQDAMLRAWRAIGKFEGRSALRSWLYTIATNTCLNLIARRPKRVLPLDYGPSFDPHDQGIGMPPVEATWGEPYPDQAPCSGRARRSTRSCPRRASRSRCARSATTASAKSWRATWPRWRRAT